MVATTVYEREMGRNGINVDLKLIFTNSRARIFNIRCAQRYARSMSLNILFRLTPCLILPVTFAITVKGAILKLN